MIFAVFDVLLAVNMCKTSFFYIYVSRSSIDFPTLHQIWCKNVDRRRGACMTTMTSRSISSAVADRPHDGPPGTVEVFSYLPTWTPSDHMDEDNLK